MYKLTEQEEKERMDLYKQGLDDRQISDKLHLSKGPIWMWRKKKGLPSNKKQGFQKGNTLGKGSALPKEEHEMRMRLYNKGLIDRKIAKVCNITVNGVCKWRKTHNLPANGKYIKPN